MQWTRVRVSDVDVWVGSCILDKIQSVFYLSETAAAAGGRGGEVSSSSTVESFWCIACCTVKFWTRSKESPHSNLSPQ